MKTERIQKEAVYRQVKALETSPAALDSAPVVMTNPMIQTVKTELAELQRQQMQLRDNLGSLHPEMVKLQRAIEAAESRLQAETQKVVASTRNDYLASQTLEQNLSRAVEDQKRGAVLMRRKEVQLEALERAAASDAQIFETLLQRTGETGVSGQSMATNIRIIDAAEVPQSPVTPRKGRDLLITLLGGLICCDWRRVLRGISGQRHQVA